MNLRRTLAVRHALTMAVALLLIALWAYLGVRETLAEQLDQAVRTTFELQLLRLDSTGNITSSPTPADPEQFVQQINRMVLVRDSAGRILQANHPLARSLALDTAGFRQAVAGERLTRVSTWWGGRARTILGPVGTAGPAGAAVLEVAASQRLLESESRSVLTGMLLTVLLGSLATLVGAFWLAGSALAPVGEIASQAMAIHGTHAGQRITVHAGVAELAGLVQVLNEMLARMERASEWHRRIIRDLGHDLRTPVTAMRAGIEVALLGSRTIDEYRRVLAGTLEEVDRLALIGDGLSLLGALESGTLRAEPSLTDVRTLVVQAVARARERVGGHPVDYEQPAQPVVAPVDPRLIGLALDQLLDNAVRHTPPGTRVEVGLASADGRLRLAVEDEGAGVTDDVLPHLFDRFYRTDAARGRNAGPGLGLTAVAVIADLHQGRVTAAHGAKGGLRIVLELPGVA